MIRHREREEKVITIPKRYFKMTRDWHSAILLSRIVYYTFHHNGKFSRTYKEWEEELGLSEYQTREAIKKLSRLGIVNVKKQKDKDRVALVYELNMENLFRLDHSDNSDREVRK